jgi:hypothetical protein
MRPLLLLAALLLAQPALAQSAERIDSSAVAFIKAEAAERSQVPTIARWMTDVYGPRLTGSPQLDAAQVWAKSMFESWGLSAQLEPWGTFGRGWHIDRFAINAHVHGPLVARQTFPIYAAPKAWSPSTGRVTGDLVVIDPSDPEAVTRLAGQLGDKVVLLGSPATIADGLEAIASRRTPEELLQMANSAAPRPQARRAMSAEAIARQRTAQIQRNQLFAEKPLAILEPSNTGGHGAIRAMGAQIPVPEGGSFGARPTPWAENAATVAQVVLLDEHFNRLHRLAEAEQRVTIDLDFEATFTPAAVVEDNVIAEIRGTDRADEVVILGGHFDSWHSGSGATDNGAGSIAVMEAARILSAYYAERGRGPSRTIRFALWTGEEQGLFGSREYVNAHYATLPGFGQPATDVKPAQAKVSAYYNLDNGSGAIRGVYLQGNAGVHPIFRAWLDAYDDDRAQTLTLQNTSGTDHLSFDAAGIPGFQFIQDGLAYGAHTWHTSMDTYDHLSTSDLAHSAAIMAVFAHHTAEREGLMPRKPFSVASRN